MVASATYDEATQLLENSLIFVVYFIFNFLFLSFTNIALVEKYYQIIDLTENLINDALFCQRQWIQT